MKATVVSVLMVESETAVTLLTCFLLPCVEKTVIDAKGKKR